MKEDVRLVAGRGRFIDDLARPRMLHAAMLRSPHAHARIVSVDARPALALPGVFAVLTGAEAASLSGPLRPLIPTSPAVPDFCLAVDRARYVGEPVAAVAAVDRATAEDALERILVDYEPLPAVVDPEAAIGPESPLLYPELGTNVIWHDTLTYGDVDGAMARADGVLRERFAIQRYASTPLETFGGIAEYDPGTDVYEFWTNDQRPGLTIASLAGALGVPQSRIRLSCPDIGGGFGNKRRPAYLVICALLARKAGRPVKWIEDRIENLTALMHACNGVMDVELAYRADGTVLALSVRDIADEGKNLLTPTQHNLIKLGNIANGYRIPAIRYEAWSVLTNKCPSGANRGIGKPFMCFAVERAMALLARRLGSRSRRAAPAQLRDRRGDAVHDAARRAVRQRRLPGDAAARARALRLRGLARRAGRGRAAGGRLLGIGIATSVEPAGTNLASYELITGRRAASGSAEAAMVRVEPDGTVRASIGDPSSGQGYETVIAQIVADELGLSPDAVHVDRGFDSTTTPWLYLSGNYSNKFSVTDMGAIVGAARARARQAPAHRRAPPGDRRRRPRAARRRGRRPRRARPAASPSPSWRAPRTPTCSACRRGRSPASRRATRTRTRWPQPIDADRRVRSQLVFSNAAHCCLVEVRPAHRAW